jgi:calcium-dependent protein kinase
MGACFSLSATKVGGATSSDSRMAQTEQKHRPQGGLNRDKELRVRVRTKPDFGYERNFESKYFMGKLLGHGQFGYTFCATDRNTGDLVAVKRIDKSKVGFYYDCFKILFFRLIMQTNFGVY